MKGETLANLLSTITERLLNLACRDDLFRSALRQLAQEVLEATQTAEPGVSALGPAEDESTIPLEPVPALPLVLDQVTAPGVGQVKAPVVDQVTAPEAITALPAALAGPFPEAFLELHMGWSALTVAPSVPSYPGQRAASTDFDLPLIEARCRLKAEAARWAATRHCLLSEGANFSTDIQPRDRDLIARAKELPQCFLWMSHPEAPAPSNFRWYEEVAGCFEALADVLGMVKEIPDQATRSQGQFERLLDLLAEAQSALRVAIFRIGGPSDGDQVQVFGWLKATASEHRLFLRRYMRGEDLADPSQWADLSARIEAADLAFQESRRQAKQRRKLLGKIRHKLSLIANEPGQAPEHWLILASTVDALVTEGLPPSNRELRDLLMPFVDRVPDLPEVPQGFQRVLREIDRFLATSPPPNTPQLIQSTPEVQEVARLLEGQSMVLIGGEARPWSQQALKEAFHLRDLIWIETREHQRIDGFEPAIARPEVALVLLAIRWSSHSYGEVQEFCDRHGKPLVRLPGGYNPNQVAAQILAQCSERLGREGQR